MELYGVSTITDREAEIKDPECVTQNPDSRAREGQRVVQLLSIDPTGDILFIFKEGGRMVMF